MRKYFWFIGIVTVLMVSAILVFLCDKHGSVGGFSDLPVFGKDLAVLSSQGTVRYQVNYAYNSLTAVGRCGPDSFAECIRSLDIRIVDARAWPVKLWQLPDGLRPELLGESKMQVAGGALRGKKYITFFSEEVSEGSLLVYVYIN